MRYGERERPESPKSSPLPRLRSLTLRVPLQLSLMLDGEFHQRVAAAQFQLFSDVGSVMMQRADADAEFVGDFLAGLVLGQQLDDAPLGGRQAFERRGGSGPAQRRGGCD